MGEGGKIGRRKKGSKVNGEELLRREKKVSKNSHTIVWRRNFNRVGSDSCKSWLQPLTQIKTNPRLDPGLVRSPVVTNKAVMPTCNARPTYSIDRLTNCNYSAQSSLVPSDTTYAPQEQPKRTTQTLCVDPIHDPHTHLLHQVILVAHADVESFISIGSTQLDLTRCSLSTQNSIVRLDIDILTLISTCFTLPEINLTLIK